MVDSKPYTYSLFGTEVTNDTKVKIIHMGTKQFLSSSNVNYTTGSKQQQVFAVVDQGHDGNWWVIRSQQEKIAHGSKIRLTHLVTGANLHTHKKIKSPVSGQQEVSCYGQNGNGDDGDYWEIRMDQDQNKANGLDQNLRVGSYFKLKHVTTAHNLHSHTIVLGDRKQEVTAFGDSDANDLWFIWVAA